MTPVIFKLNRRQQSHKSKGAQMNFENKLPLGYAIGDTWSHKGFRLKCSYYGVEIKNHQNIENLTYVYANRGRAEEAIEKHLETTEKRPEHRGRQPD